MEAAIKKIGAIENKKANLRRDQKKFWAKKTEKSAKNKYKTNKAKNLFDGSSCCLFFSAIKIQPKNNMGIVILIIAKSIFEVGFSAN